MSENYSIMSYHFALDTHVVKISVSCWQKIDDKNLSNLREVDSSLVLDSSERRKRTHFKDSDLKVSSSFELN